ncbi:glycosyltransferase involved in cell wall biosynthesis [Paenibacillus castaneae]|uniref:glycosyltransferase family 4 protein n=1 Tax=Paenibacillus castaneae TaxID=474957 RepID=UPI00141B2E2B|nr:glycosyltransferase family 4 protein [Paenibacillus castaneae]NIK78173.1 glycosyltransferase involved in cell wall biosynthesis [Paenibacillus castaneae]
MNKVYILYRSFFDLEGEELTVGGIQTYIRQLTDVIKKRNETPVIVQFANGDFHKKYNDIDVYGIDVRGKSTEQNKCKVLLEFIEKKFNVNDIIIFATEEIFTPAFTERVIAIQHGISWDITGAKRRYNYLILEVFRKAMRSYKLLKRINKLQNIVCVDYNFINWYRTQVYVVDKNIYTIPNSTNNKHPIANKATEKIKIIFARRFQIYRGTRLFASAVKNILDKYDNVEFTFAGTGPDEDYLKKIFRENPKVNFITYESEKSLVIHGEYNIAIIPSIGSEGTSLSLLEAMASKCAVIATNVGGMTNILLDNYNGRLINPNEDQLYDVIEELILNKEFREKLAENAYLTVSQAFNDKIWGEKWNKVLDHIMY